MRGWIGLISLLAFSLQQISCCCGDLSAAVGLKAHGVSSVCISSACASSVTEPAPVHCCSGSHTASHTASQPGQTPAGDESDHDSHPHHLCIGTHLFYRVVSSTVAPDPLLFVSDVLVVTSTGSHLLVEQTRLLEEHRIEPRHPPRSVLGVFVL